MKNRLSRLLWIIAATVASYNLDAAAAGAQTFAPIKPPPCSSGTFIPWNFGISSYNGGKYDAQKLPSWWCTPGMSQCKYANKLDYHARIIGNAWTSKITLYPSAFSTELNFDYMDYGIYPTPPYYFSRLTGNLGFAAVMPIASVPGRSVNGTIRFYSDSSVPGNGVDYTNAHLCSDLASVDTVEKSVVDVKHNHMFLQGAGDTVVVKIDNKISEHHTLAAWRDTGNVDVDIYVRCGAPPTATVYDFVSNATDTVVVNGEFVHYVCPANTYAYAAVNSWSGSGAVTLVAHSHKASAHFDVSVGLHNYTQPVDATRITAIQTYLRRAAGLLYGATEGGMIINFTLYRNAPGCLPCDFTVPGSCNQCNGSICGVCQVEMPPPVDQANAGTCFRGVNMFNLDHRTLAHEMGHNLACAGDEYATPSYNIQCGHSMMGSEYESSNFCSTREHNVDGFAFEPGSPLASAEAQFAASGRGYEVTETSPQYDYFSHNFRGLVGTTVVAP